MSTPNNDGFEPYPQHPQGSHPENDGGYPSYDSYADPADAGNYADQAGNYQNGYSDYSAFEVNSAASMAGNTALRFHGQQLTDNVPGDGVSPHPINDPANNGWSHVKGTGKLNILEAIGWGFKTVFGNPKLWLPLGVVYLLLSVAVRFVPTVGTWIQVGGTTVFGPWMIGAALQATLARNLNFGDVKSPTFGKTLGMSVLLSVIAMLGMTVLLTALGIGAFSAIDPTMIPENPEAIMDDPETFFAVMGPVMAAFGIGLVVMLLISPLFMLQPWFAGDNNGTFGQAFTGGFKAGARNYGRLLGFAVLAGLINLIGAIPFGLGLIVTMPATMLALAYGYRQISAGPVPQEPTA